MWNYDGGKTDILDIIPMTKGMTELGEFHRHTTRIYQARDPSINSFSI